MKKFTILLMSIITFSMVRAQSWSLTGNAATNPAVHFIGTRDSKPLRFRVGNLASGEIDSTTGQTSFGYGAGQGRAGDAPFRSVAIGVMSSFQTPGYENTAVGAYTLYNNTGGRYNVAIGYGVLYNNANGYFNTGMGYGSFSQNTSGNDNTAYGSYAMYGNTYGSYNVGIGEYALFGTTGSQFNTAIGYNAGGGWNLGYNNTILGANSGGSFSDQYNIIAIGQGVICPNNSTARIGNTATWSIGGFAGWSNFSDGRFKKDVKQDVKGLDFIMKLRPVTYHLDITNLSKQLKENNGKEWNEQMKTAIAEKEKMLFTGFVAQEVEQAAKELQYDFSGVDKPKNEDGMYALRYADFVVPIVKAIQEQQEIIKKQQEMIGLLQSKVETLEKQADIAILLQNGSVDKITAYPNPVINNMTICLQTQSVGKGILQVYETSGKLIKQMNVDIHTGANLVSLSLPELAAGHYTVKLNWGNDMHKEVSFVKTN